MLKYINALNFFLKCGKMSVSFLKINRYMPKFF